MANPRPLALLLLFLVVNRSIAQSVSQTRSDSSTRTPSQTPSSYTSSNTPSLSVTPSQTPSNTRSPSVTPSQSRTPTVTPSQSRSQTQSPSMTPSQSRTPTQTPSQSPTPTQTPSQSRTQTQTPSQTATQTQTPSQTRTQSRTQTQSPSQSRTQTQTPSQSCTQTQSPSQSRTQTQSPSQTPSQSVTQTQTPSQTTSQSQTPSQSQTETQTPSQTRTPSQTQTLTSTPSQTQSVSPTQVRTPSPSQTQTNSPTRPTTTASISVTPSFRPFALTVAKPPSAPTSDTGSLLFSDSLPPETFALWLDRCPSDSDLSTVLVACSVSVASGVPGGGVPSPYAGLPLLPTQPVSLSPCAPAAGGGVLLPVPLVIGAGYATGSGAGTLSCDVLSMNAAPNGSSSLAHTSAPISLQATAWPLLADVIIALRGGSLRSSRLGVVNATFQLCAAAAIVSGGDCSIEAAASNPVILLAAARATWAGTQLPEPAALEPFSMTLSGPTLLVLRARQWAFGGELTGALGGVACSVLSTTPDGMWAVVQSPNASDLPSGGGYLALTLSNPPIYPPNATGSSDNGGFANASFRGAALACPPLCPGLHGACDCAWRVGSHRESGAVWKPSGALERLLRRLCLMQSTSSHFLATIAVLHHRSPLRSLRHRAPLVALQALRLWGSQQHRLGHLPLLSVSFTPSSAPQLACTLTLHQARVSMLQTRRLHNVHSDQARLAGCVLRAPSAPEVPVHGPVLATTPLPRQTAL
jgi:hypothetical protein